MNLENQRPERDNRDMWFWKRKTSFLDDFPEGFRVQRIRTADAMALADLPHEQIAVYLREHPTVAQSLYAESDKRYSPSTLMQEEVDGFSVGWFSKQKGYQCERRFSNLADAATDYLLFSPGKGRWTPPGAENLRR